MLFAILANTSLYGQGVAFQKINSWEEVINKAAKLNKMIFIDCYTTWCGPCKKMDNEVFSNDTVGQFMNENYLSIKVQMDKSKNDSEYVKSWYGDALSIEKLYHVKVFPTFLFLYPNGELAHRGTSFQMATQFIELASQALDSASNLDSQLRNFKAGNYENEDLPELIVHFKRLGETEVALAAMRKYKQSTLDNFSLHEITRKETLDLILQFPALISVEDTLFQFLKDNPAYLDTIYNRPSYGTSILNMVITKDEINSLLYKGDSIIERNPEWERISTDLSQKYGNSIASQLLLNAQVSYYYLSSNWEEAIHYYVEKNEQLGIDTSGYFNKEKLNSEIYALIFKHSSDKRVLKKGIKWLNILIDSDPTNYHWLDTYANLLYKFGKINKAKKIETKAIRLAMEKQDEDGAKRYQEVLQKMTQNNPTW